MASLCAHCGSHSVQVNQDGDGECYVCGWVSYATTPEPHRGNSVPLADWHGTRHKGRYGMSLTGRDGLKSGREGG